MWHCTKLDIFDIDLHACISEKKEHLLGSWHRNERVSFFVRSSLSLPFLHWSLFIRAHFNFAARKCLGRDDSCYISRRLFFKILAIISVLCQISLLFYFICRPLSYCIFSKKATTGNWISWWLILSDNIRKVVLRTSEMVLDWMEWIRKFLIYIYKKSLIPNIGSHQKVYTLVTAIRS